MGVLTSDLHLLSGIQSSSTRPGAYLRFKSIESDNSPSTIFIQTPREAEVIALGSPEQAVNCLAEAAAEIMRKYPYTAKPRPTRPGAQVPGLGWVAPIQELQDGDEYKYADGTAFMAHTFDTREAKALHGDTTITPVIVVRWADGTPA